MCDVPVRGKPLSVHHGWGLFSTSLLNAADCAVSGSMPKEDVMARGTRPRRNRIEVWCDDDELAKIRANAHDTRLSNSEFLRNLGKGYEPKSAFDKEAIRELARLHGDQGRLGGLLKLWLSEKKGDNAPVKNVRAFLLEIEKLQMFIARMLMEQARRL
jgi:hypothetical protein